MTNIPFNVSDFDRQVAKTTPVLLKNRYFEENPVLSQQQTALIARPRLKKFMEVGTGPIRKIYSAPGAFEGDAFIISGLLLYSLSRSGVSTLIGQIGTSDVGTVSMAAAANIGDTPERLFIAEGGVLWVYTSDGYALGHLSIDSAIADNDVVEIDGVYYKWTSGSVDAGTPDGTVGSPWLLAFTSGLDAQNLSKLYFAINDDGVAGTDYSTLLTPHTTVQPVSYGAADLYVSAIVAGIFGNAITTTETGAGISWSAVTLEGGGDPGLFQVTTPDDVGALGVAHINGYIIVVPVQGEGINGRFFWVDPGEIIIDPLNFATAERSPDAINQVVVFNELFWLLGENTTEPWRTTGDPDAPMERFQGVIYDRGSWEGTAIQIKDSLVTVDEDGGVFQISGKQERISTPQIEERIRRAIQRQSATVV